MGGGCTFGYTCYTILISRKANKMTSITAPKQADPTKRDNSKFGSKGVFECEMCGRKTRATTADNESVNLCKSCYAECETENDISDNNQETQS